MNGHSNAGVPSIHLLQNDYLESYDLQGDRPRKAEDRGACGCCPTHSFTALCLIFLIVLFFISGIALSSLGVFAYMEQKLYGVFLSTSAYTVLTWALIILGGLICLVALFGGYGAFLGHKTVLKVFAILVAVLMVLELTAVVAAFVQRGLIYHSVRSSFNESIVHEYGFDPEQSSALDTMHQKRRCCGVDTYADWESSRWVREQQPGAGVHAPDSCCKTVAPNCGTMAHPNNLFDNGCVSSLASSLRDNLLLLAVIALLVTLLHLLTLTATLVLWNRVRKQLVWEWN